MSGLELARAQDVAGKPSVLGTVSGIRDGHELRLGTCAGWRVFSPFLQHEMLGYVSLNGNGCAPEAAEEGEKKVLKMKTGR